jgi:hypothetical protein
MTDSVAMNVTNKPHRNITEHQRGQYAARCVAHQ